jgi:hypothetical protein
MVMENIMYNIRTALEMYLIKASDFKLRGDNYALMLFTPTDMGNPNTKYKITISAILFDKVDTDIIGNDILFQLREFLKKNREFLYISHIEVLNSNGPFVKNMNAVFPFKSDVLEIGDTVIGGISVPYSFLCFSLKLETLREGSAIHFINTSDEIISAGIINIDHSYNIYYYTGKGLREIWGQNMTDIQKETAKILKEKPIDYLEQMGFVAHINYKDIKAIYKQNRFVGPSI